MRRVLTAALRRSGYDVTITRNGHEALDLLADPTSADVLVLDIGLPDADGRDLCQALRAAGQQAPVLFLTALDGTHERVAGFHAGGDDYVVKPFAIAEVLARLEALNKRRRPLPDAPTGLRLDPHTFGVEYGGLTQRLTPTEFRFLAAVAAEPGTVVRRRTAIAAAWPQGGVVTENTIDSYARRVRVKLAAVGSPVELKTIRGVGFVLE